MSYAYFQLEYFQGTGRDLWLQVDQILEDNFMGVNATYHQLTDDELMEIPAESVGELSLYFTMDIKLERAKEIAMVLRQNGVRVKETGVCPHVHNVDELFAHIYPVNQTDEDDNPKEDVMSNNSNGIDNPNEMKEKLENKKGGDIIS